MQLRLCENRCFTLNKIGMNKTITSFSILAILVLLNGCLSTGLSAQETRDLKALVFARTKDWNEIKTLTHRLSDELKHGEVSITI